MTDEHSGPADDVCRPAALVAGAGSPLGLAIGRGLRETGAAIVAASLTPTSPTCRSRLWDRVLRVGAPTSQGWMDAFRAAHERYGRMVLFAADDAVVRTIAEHAGELSAMFDFVTPELPVVDRLLDKSVCHEWALANGFPVPRTAIVTNHGDLRAALGELSFPVVFKPAEHTAAWAAASKHFKVHRFSTAADLERLSFDPFDAASRFVLQEWIPGRDSDVYFCLTYRDRAGRELAAQCGRKITQWRVDIGNTALAVTHHDAELHALTRRLLDAAGHVGFGSLEVRRSTRDGRMLITEPTVGRPNLQTALATAAGVNLVQVAYHDALRLPPPTRRPGREAIWIHETAFPRSVLAGARSHRLDSRTLRRVLRTRRAPVGALFSLRDPLPLAYELTKILGKVSSTLPVRRRARRS